jgi:hypothetical protein
VSGFSIDLECSLYRDKNFLLEEKYICVKYLLSIYAFPFKSLNVFLLLLNECSLFRSLECSSVVQHLLSKHEALGVISGCNFFSFFGSVGLGFELRALQFRHATD